MNICWSCGAEVLLPGKVTRDSICPGCKVAVKCCRNCTWHDPSAHNQCREPAAEWVRDKELSNFCEHWKFVERVDKPRAPKPDDARKKFDNLFKI